jgi:hypothetical protein
MFITYAGRGIEEAVLRLLRKYVVAKQRNARREFSFYALMSLAQIHQIAGGPDQNKATEVMHELMGLVLTKDQTREMYIELRQDSEIQK